METFDIVKHVDGTLEFEKKYPNHATSLYAEYDGRVGEWVKKVKIFRELETRVQEHNGDAWDVCHRMTLRIEFGPFPLQPHEDFEDEICGAIAGVIGNNINGLLENADPGEDQP